jgi:hypothetical protein
MLRMSAFVCDCEAPGRGPSGGRMLLALRHRIAQSHPKFWQNFAYKLFEVELSRGKLIPMRWLVHQALFLGADRCRSVSAKDLPQLGLLLSAALPRRAVKNCRLGRGAPEELPASRQIHDLQQRIRPSVRPFTLADHLITYCHHNEWARGLMFHEYHRVPESFVELARDSQPRIPRTVVKPKLVSSS